MLVQLSALVEPGAVGALTMKLVGNVTHCVGNVLLPPQKEEPFPRKEAAILARPDDVLTSSGARDKPPESCASNLLRSSILSTNVSECAGKAMAHAATLKTVSRFITTSRCDLNSGRLEHVGAIIERPDFAIASGFLR